MRNTGRKLLALVLSVIMLISTVPTQGFAYMAPKEELISIVGKDGTTITEGADWETAFPYGTFAFENSQLTVDEGSEPGVLRLYRLGGTAGRAIAYLTYVPAAADMADGTKAYANAAGSEDVVISVEDPLPVAQYQPLGKLPEPLVAEKQATITQNAYAGTDAGAGDLKLTLDTQSEHYQWQTRSTGLWQPVEGAEGRDFVVSAEDFATYDFRCIYTVDGQQYGSTSAKGVVYTRQEEVLPQQPADVELNPTATYSTLEMDPADPYLSYAFSVTFAEGEWVKEIRVSSPEDSVAEADKFGMFTIIDCLGGSLYDAANTLTLRAADNDAPEKSQMGFTLAAVEADKATGDAILTVRRTGGTQSVLTLDYATKDGTALAGEDYTAVSGTLTFYADADEQQIKIPLINDGIATQDRRDFSVVLSNLKGDNDKLCTLGETVATVGLWNSAKADSQNLATLLKDGGADDISGAVVEDGGSVAPVDTAIVTGTQVTEAAPSLEGVITAPKKGDASLLTYDYAWPITFHRWYLGNSDYENYYRNYWRDYRFIAQQGNDYAWMDINGLGPDPLGNWTGGGAQLGNYKGHAFESKTAGNIIAIFTDTFFEEHFASLHTDYGFRAALADNNTLFWYEAEFTYPYAEICDSVRSIAFSDCVPSLGGNWWTGYSLYWNTSGALNHSWNVWDDINCLRLGTTLYDAHGSENPARCELRNAYLQRRTFTQDMRLRIYTANDNDTHGAAAELLQNSSIYDSIKPKVSIVPGEGGVNSNGRLYTGSKLKIEFDDTGTYAPTELGGKTVYLTSSKGNVVAKATGSGNLYYLPLEWDNLDVNDTYTINAIMNRSQTMTVDITPSVPRLESDPLSPDPTQVAGAWDTFWKNNTAGKITCGIATASASAPYYSGITPVEYTKEHGFQADSNQMDRQLGLAQSNLQCVNFHGRAEDRILYNGHLYNADETIWLTLNDLSLPSMKFTYYQKEFLSALSIMKLDIQRAGLYLDKNCNGQIDGHWDSQTSFFIPDPSADEFLFNLQNNVDYDEAVFAPVAVEWDKTTGKPTKYAQYFLKVAYNMTPRALIAPPGTDLTKRAQVLPALITNVTDPGSYSRLTDQQKAYRYVISGKNRIDGAAYARSADSHIMYGAGANALSCVDIPLGGDTSPATKNEAGTGFDWNPQYQGNLLYPFAAPDPISIAHSLAGDGIPVAEVEKYEDGKAEYKDADGVQKVNGYLGSFTSSDTFALCVREQEETTDAIAEKYGVSLPKTAEDGGLALLSAPVEAGHPKPEFVALGTSGTFPNSAYLKETKSAADADGGINMAASGNKYSEFNQDMAIQLPSTDIGVTDFVSIIMDEYEVGFSIGLPLGGYNSNGDAGTGGVGEAGGSTGDTGTAAAADPGGAGDTTKKDSNNWSSPAAAMKGSGEDMGKLKDWLKNRDMASFKGTDDSYSAATSTGEEKCMSAHGFQADFSVSLAFLFKYNAVDNTYYFSQFSVTSGVELGFTYQQRFTPVPIAYVYISVGFSVEIGTGVTTEREVKERDPLSSITPGRIDSYQTKIFQTDRRAFNMTFSGKMLVECFKDKDCTIPLENSATGFVTSDGSKPVTVTLTKGSTAMNIETCYVRLTALVDGELNRVAIIDKMETKNHWNGFKIEPSAFVEAGVGIGVEIAKLEVFIKINIGCAMVLGSYDDKLNDGKGGYEGFSFDEFNFGLGMAFRMVSLIFSYEMDLIRYDIKYTRENDEKPNDKGWRQSWSALGGLFGGESKLSATDDQGATYGVRVRLPGDTSQTQSIYSGDKPQGELSPLAIKPSDAKVPFELSGYGSSGDAFKLSDGLITGYDYKVVSANGENYLIYTISRADAAHAVDNTMLVLSKLKLTGSTGKDSYGLVNPLDEERTTPYILLD